MQIHSTGCRRRERVAVRREATVRAAARAAGQGGGGADGGERKGGMRSGSGRAWEASRLAAEANAAEATTMLSPGCRAVELSGPNMDTWAALGIRVRGGSRKEAEGSGQNPTGGAPVLWPGFVV